MTDIKTPDAKKRIEDIRNRRNVINLNLHPKLQRFADLHKSLVESKNELDKQTHMIQIINENLANAKAKQQEEQKKHDEIYKDFNEHCASLTSEGKKKKAVKAVVEKPKVETETDSDSDFVIAK